MGCFAGPVIGRIARRGCERAFSRLCERSEAIHSFLLWQDGLLRCARNDGRGDGLRRCARNDGGGCFMPPLTLPVIARSAATKQSILSLRCKSILSLRGKMDCFAALAM